MSAQIPKLSVWLNEKIFHLYTSHLNTIKSKNNFLFPTIFVVTHFESRCCSLIFFYCCHCLQPWQQPKTFQGLQQVNMPLDDHRKPHLHCAMLDLELRQDTSRPPTAWTKPSPCMDAHSADTSCFLSSHVSGCISYCANCLWFSLHNKIDRSIWKGLVWTSFQQWLSPKVCLETFYIFVITYYINMF